MRSVAGGVLTLVLLAAPAAHAKPRSLAPRAFASCPQLIAHARHWQARTGGRVWAPIRGLPLGPVATGPGRQGGATPVAAPEAADTSFSTTNNQEEGVDEPDSVKTDGRRIFAVAGDSLHAVAAGAPRLLGSLKLTGGSGYELLLRGNTLLVLSHVYTGGDPRPLPAQGAPAASVAPGFYAGSTQIDEVDVSDPAAMRVRRTLTVDGDYVSARRNGDTARVVVSTSPYAIAVPSAARRAGGWLPKARVVDRRRGTNVKRFAVSCRSVRRPVAFSGLGMLTVLTIDMRRGLPAVDSD
ncbi:MAG: hypothetical protein QOJ97_3025, partial [Solirubrobacteraceae bacterium]|nr:hypothetical protein [Solirubrobacteraceae bacterium]